MNKFRLFGLLARLSLSAQAAPDFRRFFASLARTSQKYAKHTVPHRPPIYDDILVCRTPCNICNWLSGQLQINKELVVTAAIAAET